MRTRFFGPVLATFLVVALAPTGFAQNRSRHAIRGRVADANGAGIVDATVTVRSESDVVSVVRTGAKGTYLVDGLSEGEYVVTASARGFSDATKTETVSSADVDADLALTAGAISEQVTVTAERGARSTFDTAVPTSVVDRTDIERRPLATIGDAFRALPGVSTANEGPFQVRPRVRGLESNRVLVLVDGERLNNSRTSTSESGIEVGLVDVDQVDRVEVARGSGSVLYGTDALAGTINIITRDTPARVDSGFRVTGGMNGYYSSNEDGRRGSAYVAGAGTRFAFRIGQTLDRFEDYHSGAVPLGNGEKDDSDAATTVANSAYHGSATQVVGRYFIDDRQSIRGLYERRRASDVGVPGVVGVFTAFFPFSNLDKTSFRYEGYDLAPALSRLSANVYGQWQDRDFTNVIVVDAAPPFFPGLFQRSETITKTNTVGYDLQTTWALGSENTLTAGSSYFRDRDRDTRTIFHRDPDFSTFPPGLVESTDNSKSVPDSTFGNLAFFAEDEYRVTQRLRLTGGLRVDRFDVDSQLTPGFDLPALFTPEQVEDLGFVGIASGASVDDTAVTGDVGVVYAPADAVRVTARVGRSFREPNLFERFFSDFGSVGGFVVGNPDLEPETGVNVDLGVRVQTHRVAGSFNYFNNNYKNFLSSVTAIDRNGNPIVLDPGPGQDLISVFQTQNTDRARIQGVEGELEGSLPAGAVTFVPFGNFTYLRGDDTENDVPLDFITPVKLVAGLRAEDNRGRFWGEYSARLETTQDRLTPGFLETNGGAEPGFATHDIRGGVTWRGERVNTILSVGVTNLGDRYYSEQFTFAPARGRSAVVGLALRFN